MTLSDTVSADEHARALARIAALERERDDALEQQAATADVLRVIRRSPIDVEAVLFEIAERARALLGGTSGHVEVVDDALPFQGFASFRDPAIAALMATGLGANAERVSPARVRERLTGRAAQLTARNLAGVVLRTGRPAQAQGTPEDLRARFPDMSVGPYAVARLA